MNINNMFFNTLQFSANNLNKGIQTDIPKTSSSFNNQYESYKNKYEDNTTVSKTNNPNEKVKENKLKNANPTKVKEQPKESSDNKTVKDKKEISDEFIEELAGKLGVSVEEITLILEKLNIDVFSLMDNKNLNDFVQTFLNIEEPAELLISPDVQQIYKAITETIENYKEIIENTNLKDVVIPEKALEQNMTNITSINNTTNTTNEDDLQEVSNELPEENNVPIIEIKNESKGESKSNSDDKKQDNPQPAFINNQNPNYINTYNPMDIQQQILTDEIVLNTTNTVGTKDVHKIINQIVENIKVEIKPDVSEMKLILKPDHLGELSLKITTENNIITAQFIAESQQVKEVLQANFNNLKDTLQQLGLIVDELSVSVGQQNSEARQQFEQNQQKSKRRIEQIIDNIDNLENMDIVYDKDYNNPYDLSDNQVDYIA